MTTCQGRVVLMFSVVIVVTSSALVILIPAWATIILFVTTTLTWVFALLMLRFCPNLF
ncbi:hypothetical protein EDB19DRAFT_1767659 [Suillus lakei]|nr:hypothetical protein EDB19DRAFT_1767659 [Suillus lakei]